VRRDGECVAKVTVREADGKIGIEYEKALADRLHEIPRINFAHDNGSSFLCSVTSSIVRLNARGDAHPPT